MTTNFLKILGRKKPLTAAIALIMSAQAQGVEFYAAGAEINLDSQISVGSSFRLEKQDSGIIGNLNKNDGNSNYQKDDAFSQIFKGSHDLQIDYDNVGVFVRGKYWYDAALENDDNLDDSGNHDLAKFSGAQVLDAFVYATFDVADMPIDIRLGKQVVSWGESVFIQGGINSVNPVDASSFRRPGAKIKEGLIPVNMAFANISLTDDLSAEAFYQMGFHETVTEGCGTYFSTNDYQAEGCTDINTGQAGLPLIARHDDGIRRPSDDGQFGLAFRYISEALDTEFGFYAMNIHSRVPLVSGVKANVDESGQITAQTITNLTNSADPGTGLPTLTPAQAGAMAFGQLAGSLTFQNAAGNRFYSEYPEDVQIAGLSFATNVASMSVSGEVSHKKNVPLQINAEQFVGAALGADLQILAGSQDPFLIESATLTADGDDFEGYRSFEVSQVQVSAIKLFDQILGASRVSVITEAGYTFIHGFDDSDDAAIKFSGGYDATTKTYHNSVTESSWGYRARIAAEYNDAFAGVNLSPSFNFKHDVKGHSPAPGGSFKEDSKVIGLSLKADYRNTYSAAIAYNQYTGGKNDFKKDRDFASITLGMQF